MADGDGMEPSIEARITVQDGKVDLADMERRAIQSNIDIAQSKVSHFKNEVATAIGLLKRAKQLRAKNKKNWKLNRLVKNKTKKLATALRELKEIELKKVQYNLKKSIQLNHSRNAWFCKRFKLKLLTLIEIDAFRIRCIIRT